MLNPEGRSPFVIVCDHAGQATPEGLHRLGAPAEAFDRHIGWDIGAAGVAIRLGEALDACVVLQTYSRLVIDCNRDPERPDAIPEEADGAEIPGNRGLSQADRLARRLEIFDPYHAAISRALDARRSDAAVVSVHSFTPQLGQEVRPWGLGVLHEGASPLSTRVLALLRERSGYEVGDNAPYAMDGTDFTVPFHAGRRGLDYLELEIRQDLITETQGQAAMAALLASVLPLGL